MEKNCNKAGDLNKAVVGRGEIASRRTKSINSKQKGIRLVDGSMTDCTLCLTTIYVFRPIRTSDGHLDI